MRWAGHVEHMGEIRNAYEFWLENLKGRGHLEHLGVDVRMILEWILGKWSSKVWTWFIRLEIKTSGRLL